MAEIRFSKEWFEEQFRRTGRTQAELFHEFQARFRGFDRTKVNKMVNGKRLPQLQEAPIVASFFGLDPSTFQPTSSPPAGSAHRELRDSAVATASPPGEVRIGEDRNFPEMGPRDVPVMHNAAGGVDGDLIFDGQTIDYIRRPLGLMGQRVFAAYVSGDSMSPRFEVGEPIYAYLARPAAPGDYVIVELCETEARGERRGFIKKLVRKTAAALICEQFNPPMEIEYPSSEVIAVYKVVPWAELIG